MSTTEGVAREYRVVAVTTTGGQALVCVAETRGRAVAKGWLFARHDRLPDGSAWLRLERWAGGRWVAVRTGRNELPALRVSRPRVAGV